MMIEKVGNMQAIIQYNYPDKAHPDYPENSIIEFTKNNIINLMKITGESLILHKYEEGDQYFRGDDYIHIQIYNSYM